MASAQIAEEELQQSVVVSEEDVDRDEGSHTTEAEELMRHTSLSDLEMAPSISHPITLEGEGPDGHDLHHASSRDHEDEMYGMEEEEDAEGELDDITMEDERLPSDLELDPARSQVPEDWTHGGDRNRTGSSPSSNGSVASAEDAEDEGVGAVKIKPGETDDEDEDDDEEPVESEVEDLSESEASDETDGDTAWEDARKEADGEENEEDSELGPSNVCLFCKQDEEHDPGDEFEDLLACSGCGESSHQYCAREAGHLPNKTSIVHWTCPDCVPSPGDRTAEDSVELTLSQPDILTEPLDRPDTGDLSRSLRKRKGSPVDHDELSMSLRKRTIKTSNDLASATEATDPHSDVADGDQVRQLRLKVLRKKANVTVATGSQSLTVKMVVAPSRLKDVLSQRPWKSRKRGPRTADAPRPPRTGLTSMSVPFVSSAFQPFYSFVDREMDESKAKPYGGILNDLDADTSKTLPAGEDRKRFDEAKQEAEAEWRVLHASESISDKADHRKRSKKSNGPASQIECIEFGGWEIDTWYAAPYPEEYSRNRILYICEFCLKYMNSDYVAWRHKLKCPAKHPPGDEIYRHDSVSVFEVDGRKNPVYCQNLCLLAKLFLGSKTLYYDVEPFLFYVLCEYDDMGYHFVGYFSKEKRASSQNNVSCILTLPIHQRKGYGNLLIDFSYLLTRVEHKTGSPEKPLSDMGLVSYRNYWRLVMCQFLLGQYHESSGDVVSAGLSIRRISDETGLTPDDVISALEGLRCLAKDPITGLYAFRVDIKYCQDYLSKWDAKGYVSLDPASLTWTPYVMGRGNATNFELGPAITAIAPREEEEDRKTTEPLPGPGSALANDTGHNGSAVAENGPDNETASPEKNHTVFKASEILSKGGDGSESVRQSTEPNDEVVAGGMTDTSPRSDSRQNRSAEMIPPQDWASQYEGIAPSRFEVYPASTGRRADRPRNQLPRPGVLRTGSSSVRPRRPPGTAHSGGRPTPSRPKSGSSSRRKTGGTGRGPGRWPKGTKKSDYGNASSGPGLPPGWVKEQEEPFLGAMAHQNGDMGTSYEGLEAMGTVRVQFDGEGGSRGGTQGDALGNMTNGASDHAA